MRASKENCRIAMEKLKHCTDDANEFVMEFLLQCEKGLPTEMDFDRLGRRDSVSDAAKKGLGGGLKTCTACNGTGGDGHCGPCGCCAGSGYR